MYDGSTDEIGKLFYVSMGSACCVAARDRTITTGSSSEIVQRNIRYSPTWSFRWDNRGRVAGEETSLNWFSEGVSRNAGMDIKSQTTVGTTNVSEEGSPLDSFRTLAWQKSPISEGHTRVLSLPPSDPSISAQSMEVKQSSESLSVPNLSPTKMSPSMRSVSSFSASPLSSHSLLPATSTPSRWTRRSPGLRSPNFSISEEGLPGWSNESIVGSHGGSSDGWSIPAFAELMATSHNRERWSFDSESLGVSRDKINRSSGRISSCPSIDIQTCGVCSKLLTERSSIITNELAVVAILICGHVYHAECLENMTPEISKYDPACPVCTFGEKQVLKFSEKALRAEIDLKAKNKKRWKKRVVDGDLDSDSNVFDSQKNNGNEVRGPKMSLSSSMKSSLGKPFLRRHFSLGPKGGRSLSEKHSSQKKGIFWAKSSKQ